MYPTSYMQFVLSLRVNSDDADFELQNLRQKLNKILGSTNIMQLEFVQLFPGDWDPGDPIPVPGEPENPDG